MAARPLTLALAIALIVGGAVAPTVAQAGDAANASSAIGDTAKAQKLETLYDEYWEETLRLNPIQATFQGDPRYNDQLPNFLTARSRRENREFIERWLKRVEDIGP